MVGGAHSDTYIHGIKTPSLWKVLPTQTCHSLGNASSMALSVYTNWVSKICRVWFTRRQRANSFFIDLEGPTRWPGNMVSPKTCTRLASDADCLFSCLSVSDTPGSSRNWYHILWWILPMGVSRPFVSWLLHVLGDRLMGCHPALPRTFSERSLSMSWWSVFVVAWSLPVHHRHLQ